jgi:hypothetical protein
MNSVLPCSLDKGIYLDDSDTLLAWNSSRDDLLNLASPQTMEQKAHRLALAWRNRRWMGGMAVTVSTAMGQKELFRNVDILPLSEKRADEQFASVTRHMTTHLGKETRRTERPDRQSRWWRFDEVEISLKLNGGAQFGFTIIYHGAKPGPLTADSLAGSGWSFERHIEQLGLTFGQWSALKNYLLDLQDGVASEPPPELRDHPVVVLATQYRQSGNPERLDRAAIKLTGSAKSAWLILWKS